MYELTGVQYQGVLAIDTLQIPQSKTTCIVGPSGSGKTTLLRLLNHLISPDQGTILYRGQNIEELDSVKLRREVVMLQQHPVIFPGKVKDNLTIGCTFSELPIPSDQDLTAVLAEVKLNKSLDKDVENLSGGEKQRLALARVLVMEPPVLLLDEPSSALDEETERLVFDVLSRYCNTKERTLIMVTHSRTVADKYADIRVEVKAGKIAGREEIQRG